ncbi:hypothetical protein [Elizabethkingia anophelis]|uniref:hypothetical protein n=1 Tax=Elizabethkingia anophelis TaxID=1117645 RepID=UPI00075191A4|nr:hypothetical protein [Elizabethkingia anophelis]AQW91341.1 hypothetical protein BBD28_12035 [Elizabethkingia anophelis]KUY14207.1 hypothetical protein ATB94_09415 [Elizabethkingia anophelis]MDV3749067.1 hypothetical protein [Elizabethkingia anophelis]
MKLLRDESGTYYILQEKKPNFLVELVNINPFEVRFIIKDEFFFYHSTEKEVLEEIEKFVKSNLEF